MSSFTHYASHLFCFVSLLYHPNSNDFSTAFINSPTPNPINTSWSYHHDSLLSVRNLHLILDTVVTLGSGAHGSSVLQCPLMALTPPSLSLAGVDCCIWSSSPCREYRPSVQYLFGSLTGLDVIWMMVMEVPSITSLQLTVPCLSWCNFLLLYWLHVEVVG